jgi:hypothetical protein
MRRTGEGAAICLLVLGLAAWPVLAQQGPINPRIPPPPPPPDETAAPAPAAPPAEQPALLPPPAPTPVPVPATVELLKGTRIPVTLETPLSTRISKKGQQVIFRTTDPVPVESLELPPDTEISATVVEARRPGGFGRPGTLKVRIDGIRLSNSTHVEVPARLDSADVKQGKISADRNAGSNVMDLAQWATLGTLVGWQTGGGSGAGYGAAAGAAAALIIMMARRGPDLYLEPGMPFAVVVDQDTTLPGAEIHAAQQAWAAANPGPSSGDSSSASVDSDPADNSRVPASRRPVLKRRPRP